MEVGKRHIVLSLTPLRRYRSLHGITGRVTDTATPALANIALCPGVSLGDVLPRTTRYSVTVRNVAVVKAAPTIMLARR